MLDLHKRWSFSKNIYGIVFWKDDYLDFVHLAKTAVEYEEDDEQKSGWNRNQNSKIRYLFSEICESQIVKT